MKNGQGAAARVSGRFGFWRGGFRRVGLTNVVGSSVLLMLALGHIYMAHHLPEPSYRFTDSHGNLVDGTPLNRPVMSDADLMDFAVRSVLAVYNFDYVHARETLSRDASPNFTASGWEGVAAAVETTHSLKEIEARSISVSAIPLAGPAIRKWAEVRDHLAWGVQFPVRVTYANTNESRVVDLMITATVMRVPTALYPKGIAIDSFVAEPPK